VNAALSTRQRNVEPASSELNVNVGAERFVGPAGPLRIDVFGPAASTVTERVVAPLSLPATSRARTL
jgi:hypothetical protein